MYEFDLLRTMATRVTPEMLGSLANVLKRFASPVESRPPGPLWWHRPGIGIMYLTEYRPGMDWDRDYTEFNRSMTGADGKINFNGPFCKVEQWVELSAEVGVDYHIMAVKWHDGICYFDTALTDWKADKDYAGRFAEGSRAAGIPFLFYYSAVFDHNPMFDPVQPRKDMTASFLGIPSDPTYEEYLRGQYREIMDRYRPDGMWIDWYWPDSCTRTTLDYFKTNHPETVLTFNISSLFRGAYKKLHYTSAEAHDLDGSYVVIRRLGKGVVVIMESAWKLSALARRVFDHPWEFVTPVGRWWQNPTLRDDPLDLLRMAAVVMACGGRLCMGAAPRLDGSLFPDQVEQLRLLGDWYRPRRSLFHQSCPLRYRRKEPPGVEVHPGSIKAIACRAGGDILLHLINMDGATRPVRVKLSGRRWRDRRAAFLEPHGRGVDLRSVHSGIELLIGKNDVDAVDTIVRLAA